jgi:hypothetical protein
MTTRIQTFNGNIGIGTNDPGSYKLRVDGSVRANSLEINGVTNAQVPSGLIAMWSGTVASVPTGWALCDGTSGTPNLVGKFIRGASGDSPSPVVVGTSGGANTVSLSENNLAQHNHSGNSGNQSSSHSHEFTSGNNSAGHTHGGDTGNQSANHTHGGDTGNQSANHTHEFTSGTQSANHNHPVGNQSANHTHPVGNNNRNHTHNIPDLYYQPGRDWHQGQGTQSQYGNVNWFGPWNSAATTNVNANHGHPIGNNSVNHNHANGNNSVNHTHSGDTGNQSASHTHEFTSGNNSRSHTHEFTTGGASATHTHSGDTGNQSSSHNHTITIGNAGNGVAFSITNPYYALAYIMKL